MNKLTNLNKLDPSAETSTAKSNDFKNLLKKVRLKRINKSVQSKDRPKRKILAKSINLRKSFNINELILKTYNPKTPNVLLSSSFNKNLASKFNKSFRSACDDVQSFQEKIEKGMFQEVADMIDGMNENKRTNKIWEIQVKSWIQLGKYEKALEVMEMLMKRKGMKSVRLCLMMMKVLSLLMKSNELIEFLEKAHGVHPNNTKISTALADLLYKSKDYNKCKKVLKNFQDDSSMQKVCEALRKQKDFKKSLKYCQRLSFLPLQYLVNGKVLYSQQNFGQSLELLLSIPEGSKCFDESLYYCSKCFLAQGNIENSELYLEKLALSSINQDLVARAVFKITLIKLNRNDYFGAYHSIQRVKVEGQSLSKNKEKIKIYALAGYLMIQNSPKEAIEPLTKLVNSEETQATLYKFLTLRAFCFISIENYESSQLDYEKASSIQDLDQASNTNLLMSKAMQVFMSNDYAKCIKMINIRENCPSMLKIIYILSKIHKASYLAEQNMLKSLIKPIKTIQKDSEICRVHSFLLYCSKDFDKSLKLIKKSQKYGAATNLTKIIESFNYISNQQYQEAQELLMNIDLDSSNSFFAVFPYRALCNYYTGNRSLALADIYKIINENSYRAYLLSIYLLIISNEINEALLVLSIIESTLESKLLKAHCLIVSMDFHNAIEVLTSLEKPSIANDIRIIQGLQSGKLESADPGTIFNEKYMIWINAIKSFYSGDFDQAINLFESVGEILWESQNDQFFYLNPGYLLEFSLINYNLSICLLAKGSEVKCI